MTPHQDQIRHLVRTYNMDYKTAKRMLRRSQGRFYPVQISSGYSTIKALESQGYKQFRDFFYAPRGRFLFADESLATMVKMMDNL